MSIILHKVVKDLHKQEMKGIRKYGGTLDADFNELEVLQHAYEEALDLCMYLAKTIQIKRKKALIELTQDEPYERTDKSGDSEKGSEISGKRENKKDVIFPPSGGRKVNETT